MKQLFKNLLATITFFIALGLHVYFALLLITQPAWAETAGVETAPTASEAKAATAEPQKENSDSDINIKFNMKEGLTVKGFEGALKKLEEMDKSGKKINIDQDGIQVSNDDDRGEGGRGPRYNINVKNKSPFSLLIPIISILGAFSFAAYAVYSKNRTRRDYLETIKALAQSGQPIPPELMSSMSAGVFGDKSTSAQNFNDPSAIKGIKFIFIGIGVFGCVLLLDAGHAGGAFGFLFLVIGAFHIYSSQLIQKQKNQSAAPLPNNEDKK